MRRIIAFIVKYWKTFTTYLKNIKMQKVINFLNSDLVGQAAEILRDSYIIPQSGNPTNIDKQKLLSDLFNTLSDDNSPITIPIANNLYKDVNNLNILCNVYISLVKTGKYEA